MNGSKQKHDPSALPGDTRTTKMGLWQRLCQGTAWIYAKVARSLPGRAMTGYRQVEGAIAGGRRGLGRHRVRPMSPARLRLVETVEDSRLLAGLRALFSALFNAPLAFYGLFGLFYGLSGVILSLATIVPVLGRLYAAPAGAFLAWAIIALLSLPLAFTHVSLADALGNSRLMRGVLVHLLGVPQDRLNQPTARRKRMPVYLPYVALALALGSTALVALTRVTPAAVPLILLALGAGGLIFTYPEAGVILSTVLLPAIWLYRDTLFLLVALLLLTWCSYGVKLLFLHRTIRFGVLDRVVLIFGFLVLASGFAGAVVNRESMAQSFMLFVCLSDYFLIVNLMNSRPYIRRCLVGVGASVAIVTALAYLRLVPADGLSWLEGSFAGNGIVSVFTTAMTGLSGLWVEHSELFLVLVFPWLYAYLLHTKRLFRRVLGLVFIALDLTLILMTRSVSALVCAVVVTLLFFLLLGHKWLARSLVALPVVGCVAWWLVYLFPLSEEALTVLSRSRLYKNQLWDSLWQMVRDFPAGIGLGDASFDRVYPAYAAPDLGAVEDSGSLFFEVLLNFGWAGLLIAAVLLFLFFQKGMTCLQHTSASKDRAVILGGITSLVGVLIFGSVRSFILFPRVIFTLTLVVALCSAYENIIFDESDVLTAHAVGSPNGEDRIYRKT